jgi:hypothetical protein
VPGGKSVGADRGGAGSTGDAAALIAADPQALTVAEMIAAMRHRLGRRPNVFPLPATLLELLLRAASRECICERLSDSLVADPSALMCMGWTPPLATAAALAALVSRGRGPRERGKNQGENRGCADSGLLVQTDFPMDITFESCIRVSDSGHENVAFGARKTLCALDDTVQLAKGSDR